MGQKTSVAMAMPAKWLSAARTRDGFGVGQTQRPLMGVNRLTRCFATFVVALGTSTLPMAVQAAQDGAIFQVSLKILPRQPAPRVVQHGIAVPSPGFPPYRLIRKTAATAEPAASTIILLETEF